MSQRTGRAINAQTRGRAIQEHADLQTTISAITATGPAGGDLSGTYPNPSVTSYSGTELETDTIVAGRFIIENSAGEGSGGASAVLMDSSVFNPMVFISIGAKTGPFNLQFEDAVNMPIGLQGDGDHRIYRCYYTNNTGQTATAVAGIGGTIIPAGFTQATGVSVLYLMVLDTVTPAYEIRCFG